jgi:hypothetical protein
MRKEAARGDVEVVESLMSVRRRWGTGDVEDLA